MPTRTELEIRAAQRILPRLRNEGVTPATIQILERWAHIIETQSGTPEAPQPNP